MGIFNLFKKRVAKNIIKTVETQSEYYNKQKNEPPKIRFLKKIQASTPKYKTAEAVINILQNNGFVLKYITTYGEYSAHDGTDSFHNEYHSIEEFTSKVYNDFNAHKKRIEGAAILTWSCTFFKLYHENLNLQAIISLGEDDGNDEPREAYLSIRIENTVTADEEYITNIEEYITNIKECFTNINLILQPFFVPNFDCSQF